MRCRRCGGEMEWDGPQRQWWCPGCLAVDRMSPGPEEIKNAFVGG